MAENSIEGEAKTLAALAESGELNLEPLRGFIELVETTGSHSDVTPDDLEWLQLYAAVLEETERADRARDFGFPRMDDEGEDEIIPWMKVRQFYQDMERQGAIQDLTFTVGGGGVLRCTDLRPVVLHVERQVLRRLRMMGLLSESASSVSDDGRPEQEDESPPWFVDHLLELVISVAAIVLGAFILWLLGIPS